MRSLLPILGITALPLCFGLWLKLGVTERALQATQERVHVVEVERDATEHALADCRSKYEDETNELARIPNRYDLPSGVAWFPNPDDVGVACQDCGIYPAEWHESGYRFPISDQVLRPDPDLTPGVAAIIDAKKVCSVKWSNDERHVTAAMKAEVYHNYGVVPKHGICRAYTHKTKKGKTVTEFCEIDHLISRELGGADDVSNLWPQPYRPIGAHEKDRLENWLHKQVCAGKLSLAGAQYMIVNDWYVAYLEMPVGRK